MKATVVLQAVVALFCVSCLGAAAKNPKEQVVVIYSFSGGSDGDQPYGVVLDSNGDLLGTASAGGDLNCDAGAGCGTAFRLTQHGSFTLLHTFENWDGNEPMGRVRLDGDVNLYGTTVAGGGGGSGTVFRVAPDGAETVLYAFFGGSDGGEPQYSNLTFDQDGNVYGVAEGGGDPNCLSFGCGVVFKVSPQGTETVLHAFHGGRDGAFPLGGPTKDKSGNLYGVTEQGGGSGKCAYGCGTVFKIDTQRVETVIYSFSGGRDGRYPIDRPIRDRHGNLYGVAEEGGKITDACSSGCGVVYSLSPNGTFAVLHTFQGGSGDGAYPSAALNRAPNGNIYGTTDSGGTSNCGTLFRIEPNGAYTIIHNFNGADGTGPDSRLVRDKDGYLYGTTVMGGAHGWGTVFRIKKR